MTLTSFISQPINKATYVKSILIGAGFALVLMTTFLMADPDPNPVWGKYYMIRPLIIVPFA